MSLSMFGAPFRMRGKPVFVGTAFANRIRIKFNRTLTTEQNGPVSFTGDRNRNGIEISIGINGFIYSNRSGARHCIGSRSRREGPGIGWSWLLRGRVDSERAL